MKPFLQSLRNYGLIIFTVIYIVCLIVIDNTGYFIKTTAGKLNLLPGNISGLSGKVISYPELKSNRLEFYLKVIYAQKSIGLLARVYNIKETPELGDILEVSGKIKQLPQPSNPGQFDYGMFLIRDNISGIITLDNYSIVKKHASWYGVLSALKSKMIESIVDNLPEQEASVLTKMFIGEKSGIEPYIREIFTDAGVMHTLVVSGMNIAYVVAIFWFMFKLVPMPNRIRQILLIPPIIAYCFVTGASAPITRATIMSIAFISAYMLKRESLIYHTFSLSALIILFFNPQALFGASMQLSFAACIGIVFLYPKTTEIFNTFMDKYLNRPESRLPSSGRRISLEFLKLLFFTSFAAQLATAPLLAYYFYKVSLIAILSNLVVVPFVGIILILCFILFFSTLIIPFLAPLLGYVTNVSTFFLIKTVDFFASFPSATIPAGKPSILFIIIYYILLIIIFNLKNIRNRSIGFLIFCFLAVFSLIPVNFTNKSLMVTFLDVGLGDCIFIETPDNKHIFIDCGGSANNAGRWTLQPFLLSKGITRIDKVIITTRDWTHYQGLRTLIENFNVKEILLNNNEDDVELTQILQTASRRNIKINRITDKIDFGKVSLIFYQAESIITKIKYNNESILLTSDATEKDILRFSKQIGKVNILEIPRHAYRPLKRATIDLLDPEHLIVSTDRKTLKPFSRQVFSTSKNGAVAVSSDGNTTKITPFISKADN